MSGASQAVTTLMGTLRAALRTVAAFRAIVSSTSGGLVGIRRIEATTADSELYARLAGFTVAATDEVIVIPIGGQPVVLGKLQRSAPSGYALDAALTVPAINTPVVNTLSQSTSNTTSTTNTSTFQDAGVRTVFLPAGTWTLNAVGGLQLKHSAGGNADWRIEINGDGGTARTRAISATSWETVVDDHGVAGLTGTVDVKVQFKSNAAGTTSAQNPWLLIVATRTA